MGTKVFSSRASEAQLSFADKLSRSKHGISYGQFCGTLLLDAIEMSGSLPPVAPTDSEEKRASALSFIKGFAASSVHALGDARAVTCRQGADAADPNLSHEHAPHRASTPLKPRRIMLDGDILHDAICGSPADKEAALEALDSIAIGESTGYASALSLASLHPHLVTHAGQDAARELIACLMEVLNIKEIDHALCRIATLSCGSDLSSALVRACAEDIPADLIVTKRAHAYDRSMIRCVTPQRCCEIMRS